jgi:hypothetical protein
MPGETSVCEECIEYRVSTISFECGHASSNAHVLEDRSLYDSKVREKAVVALRAPLEAYLEKKRGPGSTAWAQIKQSEQWACLLGTCACLLI